MKQYFFNLKAICLLLASFSLLSCGSTGTTVPTNSHHKEFSFTAKSREFNSDGEETLERLGSEWQGKESVGIYMLEAKERNVIKANARFNNTRIGTSAHFLAMGMEDKLQIPKSKTVSLIAYYPYRADASANGQVAIDLEDQTGHAEYDFLVANNLSDISKYGNYNLTFTRELALIEIQLINIPALQQAAKPEATIGKVGTKATFNLFDKSWTDRAELTSVRMHVEGEGATRLLSAYLLPSEKPMKLSCQIALGDKSYMQELDLGMIQAGKKYVHTFKLQPTPDPETPMLHHPYLEIPKLTKEAGYTLVFHNEPISDADDSQEKPDVRNYTYLYDNANKMALWVAYPLHNYYVGNFKRENKWHKDHALPQEIQAEISKAPAYYPTGTFDRGHQVPSADRTSSAAFNHSTFTSANSTPQKGKEFNQNIWKYLEEYVRNEMKKMANDPVGYDTLYVVTGAMPKPYAGMADDYLHTSVTDHYHSQLTLPVYYYKALARRLPNGEYRTIAFCLPHRDLKGRNFRDFSVTVEELERRTGFIFFPAISTRYKQTRDADTWNKVTLKPRK
ncbi:MAG: DNA/RNA non-specific endonuclease [Porphyromonas sp.]|nr:DNA/RNA non-specific endonuclease [Porphyromonas sp.]